MLGASSNIYNGSTLGDIGILIDKVDDIHSDMGTVVSDISKMEEYLSSISGGTDAGVVDSINNLKTAVDNLTSLCDLTPITTKLNTHDTNTLSLLNKNKSSLTDLTNYVQKLSKLDTVETQLTSVKTDLDKIYSKLTTLDLNTIKTNQETIINKCNLINLIQEADRLIYSTFFYYNDGIMYGYMNVYYDKIELEILGGKADNPGTDGRIVLNDPNNEIYNYIDENTNNVNFYFPLTYFNSETNMYETRDDAIQLYKDTYDNKKFFGVCYGMNTNHWSGIIIPQKTFKCNYRK